MTKTDPNPPYLVPTMDEIRALEPNGYTVASTFSGAGGSSLGYRMAGFTVRWANEFVPAAAEVYRMNAAEGTVLNTDDIRTITGAQLCEEAGVDVGELDILDGSPPCASFSSAGSSSAGWGQERTYSDTRQRVDDLFYEFARLLSEAQPKTFVAENVKGLVRGVSKGYFKAILRELENSGYRVSARVLDASWLDVPQARERLIFIGVRKDLGLDPAHPSPFSYRRTAGDALGHTEIRDPKITAMQNARSGRIHIDDETGERIDLAGTAIGDYVASPEFTDHGSTARMFLLTVIDPKKPSPTITATGGRRSSSSAIHWEARKLDLRELRSISSFPPDFKLAGDYPKRAERIGRAVPPLMMKAIADTVRSKVLDQLPK